MRLGDTPVLIPNTMVKTLAADGTMLETAWESRWLPEPFKNNIQKDDKIRWIYQWFKFRKTPEFEWLINISRKKREAVLQKFAQSASDCTLKTEYWK